MIDLSAPKAPPGHYQAPPPPQTNELLLKIAKKPRDHHKYADTDAPPVPDGATEAQLRRAAWSARRLFKQNASAAAHQRLIKCQYCQDRRFIMLDATWLDADVPVIPRDAIAQVARFVQHNPVRGCVRVPGPDEFMVPCDCHTGLTEAGAGNSTQEKPVQRFEDIFGCKLSDHPFGQAIARYRRARYDADKARPAEDVMAEAPLKQRTNTARDEGPIVHVEPVTVTPAPSPDDYEYQESEHEFECPF